VDKKIREAILGHADYTGTPRNSLLAKTLFAVDELSGFITAVCYVTYPGKPKVKSVNKKLKDKSFAAKVSREEILKGIEELGVDKNEHIERVIDAVWEVFEKFKSGEQFL
jgi:predicted hydrolase (HD superfamily)